ncbi:MAG TPA: NUDIX hydrolase [Vitreimonas sp.]|nr:NUDIX hydrolase [Vitreimonas sp.]
MSSYISQWYRHCPHCGTELQHHSEGARCQTCEFVVYDNPAGTVTVVVKNPRGEILLAKRGIEPFKGWWDLPGGFIKGGETFEEAAHRELKEETNLEIVVTKYLGQMADVYQGRDIIALLYAAQTQDLHFTAQDDVTELAWFKLSELPPQIAFKNCQLAIDLYRQAQEDSNVK